jgi:hypothetical protein
MVNMTMETVAGSHTDRQGTCVPGEYLNRTASNEIPTNRRVDFDTTVDAMALTAKEMNSKYKETSEGGLAVSLVLC